MMVGTGRFKWWNNKIVYRDKVIKKCFNTNNRERSFENCNDCPRYNKCIRLEKSGRI